MVKGIPASAPSHCSPVSCYDSLSLSHSPRPTTAGPPALEWSCLSLPPPLLSTCSRLQPHRPDPTRPGAPLQANALSTTDLSWLRDGTLTRGQSGQICSALPLRSRKASRAALLRMTRLHAIADCKQVRCAAGGRGGGGAAGYCSCSWLCGGGCMPRQSEGRGVAALRGSCSAAAQGGCTGPAPAPPPRARVKGLVHRRTASSIRSMGSSRRPWRPTPLPGGRAPSLHVPLAAGPLQQGGG